VSDQGTCFVFHNYVFNEPEPSRTFLGYLYGLRAKEKSSALLSAMDALGLASLGNIKMAPTLMIAARKEYISALVSTNAALRDPVLSKADSTLTAVTLLGMYEVSGVGLSLYCTIPEDLLNSGADQFWQIRLWPPRIRPVHGIITLMARPN
jgi:uncharacterized membrane protein